MSEKIKSIPEARDNNSDTLKKAGAEKLVEIQEKLENSARLEGTSNETLENSARHEALEIASPLDKQETTQQKQDTIEGQIDSHPANGIVETRYSETLSEMRSKLNSNASRTFSKVIHNPIVDKTSEVVGNTVARPNLIIAGAIGAIASVIVYFIARRYGYPLSGFETIGLFIAGWLAGAIIEFARVGFLNKK